MTIRAKNVHFWVSYEIESNFWFEKQVGTWEFGLTANVVPPRLGVSAAKQGGSRLGGDRSSALKEQQGGSREVGGRGDGREAGGGSSSGWCGKPLESFAWEEGR